MQPEFTSRTRFTPTAHPGRVAFVGSDGTVRVESADTLPDWLKFAPAADGTPMPVVRIVRQHSDNGYVLRSYGADGRLLWIGRMTIAAQTHFDSPVRNRASTNRLHNHGPVPNSTLLTPEPSGWF